jgi:ergothioneine biosynthesis protein EgtB
MPRQGAARAVAAPPAGPDPCDAPDGIGRMSLVADVPAGTAASATLQGFLRVRQRSVALAAPLSADDACAQSMPEASPAKWHLAHTSWFFEQFLLGRDSRYQPWRPGWSLLFNSYYETVGPRVARAQRGLITRPGLAEVLAYRQAVDARVAEQLARDPDPEALAIVQLGVQHEQQHQELLLTDIKHLLSLNPLAPAYRDDLPVATGPAVPLRWIDGASGRHAIGHEGDGFAFDCETPRHAVLLSSHALANRPVTNAEYREFIRDGGYERATLWMAEGWDVVQREQWRAPLYWDVALEQEFTLGGRRAIDPHAPVSHVSFYEADAYARWAGARLPTEAEWETAAAALPGDTSAQANLADTGLLHPAPAADGPGLRQMVGDVWEWTGSPYVAYPRFRPAAGAIGEYNGKFMCGQWVLRGGSCATPAGHLRPTYRNFFYPRDRWQFMGVRLARDC